MSNIEKTKECKELKKALAEKPELIDEGLRICEFCGCRTNAHLRACCNKGREADLDEKPDGEINAL
jgi:hypothetical protein